MFKISWIWVAMTFCGGVFGAAVGALPSLVLCWGAERATVGTEIGSDFSALDGVHEVVDKKEAAACGEVAGPYTRFVKANRRCCSFAK